MRSDFPGDPTRAAQSEDQPNPTPFSPPFPNFATGPLNVTVQPGDRFTTDVRIPFVCLDNRGRGDLRR
jgi:hypothetical protein